MVMFSSGHQGHRLYTKYLAFFLWVALLLVFILPAGEQGRAGAEEAPLGKWSDTQHALEQLNEREKEILSELFKLSLETEQLNQTRTETETKADQLRRQVAEAEGQVNRAKQEYLTSRDTATGALRTLQRLGPASYLEILLGASTLKDFFRRLDMVAVAVKGFSAVLNDLREEELLLTAREERLHREKADLDAVLLRLMEQLADIERIREQKAEILASAGIQKVFYANRLGEIEGRWQEVTREYLGNLSAGFSRLTERTAFDLPGMRMEPSLEGLRMVIPLSDLNRLFGEEPALEGVSLISQDGQLILEAPGESLQLIGDFELAGATAIRYRVDKARFTGIDLPPTSLTGIVREQLIKVDFTRLLAGLRIKNVTAQGDEVALILGF
ncbi:MAG: coiled-coil domain-containing protein [Bacillota bacterium]